jgi:hypothetical protein
MRDHVKPMLVVGLWRTGKRERYRERFADMPLCFLADAVPLPSAGCRFGGKVVGGCAARVGAINGIGEPAVIRRYRRGVRGT